MESRTRARIGSFKPSKEVLQVSHNGVFVGTYPNTEDTDTDYDIANDLHNKA